MADILKLNVLEAQEISLIDSGNAYSSGKRKDEGKTFARFRYNGIVFTIPDDNPFISAFNEGTVASVKLLKGKRTTTVVNADGDSEDIEKDTLQFDSFTSMRQVKNGMLFQAQIAAIGAMSTKTSELSEESLSALLGATI
jgi:hypothetical protein